MEKLVYCVVPNWNGKDTLAACLDSLLAQNQPVRVVVVDNGSHDGSVEFIQTGYPSIDLVRHDRNLGFAGGVNAGIRFAMEHGATYVALFNNDAVADKNWLKHLVDCLDTHRGVGIATCKLMDLEQKHFDSTGDMYTTWGLPFPRGRGEPVSDHYDKQTLVFAASGGASLYRTSVMREIGLFDEDFFAYYEDVDLSFRAQLAGYKVAFVPTALAFHDAGTTSSKVKGFTTYQTMKNLPLLFYKNMPGRLFWKSVLRFKLAYVAFFFSAIIRGQAWPAFKGILMAAWFMPKKLGQRWFIQHRRRVSVDYIDSILIHDLPPNASKLRRLRGHWRKLIGKRVTSE